MTTNSPRPCRSVKPSACPYHGPSIRMEEAMVRGDYAAYDAAKTEFDKAIASKQQALLTFPTAPAGASYEYSGAKKTTDRGIKLYRIRATRDIPSAGVKQGDLGGWVDPLPLDDGAPRISGDAWVSENAEVSGNARISGKAHIFGSAWVEQSAQVSDNAQIYGNSKVSGYGQVSGNAQVFGDAWVEGKGKVSEDAKVGGGMIVSGNAEVYGTGNISGNAWLFGDVKLDSADG